MYGESAKCFTTKDFKLYEDRTHRDVIQHDMVTIVTENNKHLLRLKQNATCVNFIDVFLLIWKNMSILRLCLQALILMRFGSMGP